MTDDGATFLAVIGMACRFPGAADCDELWANLAAGVESISFFPAEEGANGYLPACGVLDEPDRFDAAFFGYSPREALVLDPQHRGFLECAWEALERAGYDPRAYEGSIGVYAGSSDTSYAAALLARRSSLHISEYQLRLATGMDFLATRVSYKLGLTGPGVAVQTACSTSLVAIHAAAQALLSGECDMALAGGACVHVPTEVGEHFEGSILAPDGHCRAFDANAQGTIGGDGIGIVVLKRLEDALADGDHVHAVLRGSAVNNDGIDKIGFTAPSVDGQAQAIRTAQLVAGVEPETIGYVETHGTGTPLGDPIEIAALTKAFGLGPGSGGRCLIGSVKTNIGHTDAAAGVAGFIKAVLALERGQIPPSLNFETPNPQIDFAGGPFAVATELEDWDPGLHPRRAGVSSFGIGGTNAHVVLEEPPERGPSDPCRPQQLLVLSARTPTALAKAGERLAGHLRKHPDFSLGDVAWTLQAGRQPGPFRAFAVAADAEDAVRALTDDDPARLVTGRHEPRVRPVVFMFPGQGGQHVGMGRELYEHEPVFRAEVDRCAELAAERLGLDLRDVLFADRDDEAAARRLAEIAVGQPAVFVVEVALARLLASLGVEPGAVVGHSLGAFAAACVAGVLSLEDARGLVIERGRLLQTRPAGAMLAVPLTEEDVLPLLRGGLGLATINGPAQCVISGPAAEVRSLQDELDREGIDARLLHISTAGHSLLVEPIVAEFERLAGGAGLKAPETPLVSDTHGSWLAPEDAADPAYWARHLRQPVRFSQALSTLLADPDRILVEVGPGRTLATLARQHPELQAEHVVTPTLPHPVDRTSELATLLSAVGRLWLAGTPIDWRRLHEGERRRRVPLPTYPFEGERYLVEPPAAPESAEEPLPPLEHPAVLAPSFAPESEEDGEEPQTEAERLVARAFQEILGLGYVGRHDNFFELGGDSLIGTQLIARLRQVLDAEVPLRALYEAPTVAELAASTARKERNRVRG
jgi:phthiocerol/phenolphthiocerol synthesis type-I polyketide synthase E